MRQPKEYELEHLPGAALIPVKELLSRVSELSPDKTTLVYCASGVRSKAACQILKSHNFSDVYNISGGIKAWNGIKARGQETMGMEFFASTDFKDAFSMAYMMEDGLQQLYLAFDATCDSKEEKDMLLRLASFEDLHKAKLIEDFKPERKDIPAPGQAGNIMEGGFDREAILNHFKPHLYDREDILNLAMMLETQTYDLYMRVSRKCDDPKTRDLFLHLAEEEKTHLGYIARELDKFLNRRGK